MQFKYAWPFSGHHVKGSPVSLFFIGWTTLVELIHSIYVILTSYESVICA